MSREGSGYLHKDSKFYGRFVIKKILREDDTFITYGVVDTLWNKKAAISEYYPKSLVMRDPVFDTQVKVKDYSYQDRYYAGKKSAIDTALAMMDYHHEEGMVSVTQYLEMNNTVYIIMEYERSITLGDYISKNGPMDPDELFERIKPVFRAVSAIHKHKEMHGRISADTLKVAETGRMFIEDFGCIGQEKSLDPTVDIYMLGSVIYYALTGESVPAINRRSGRDAADLAPLYELHIPDYVKEAIAKALSVSKAERYQTVKGFADHFYNQAFIDVTEAGSGSRTPVQGGSPVKSNPAHSKRDVSGKGPLVSDKRPAKKTVPKNTARQAAQKKKKSPDTKTKTIYDQKTGRFLVRNTDRKSGRKRRKHSFVIFAVVLIIILNISSVFRSLIKTMKPDPDPVPYESYMTTTNSLRFLTLNDTSYYAPVTLSELTGEGWETDSLYYQPGDDNAGGTDTDGDKAAAPDDFADPKGGTYKALLHSGNFNLELTLYAPSILTGSRVEDLPASNLYLYRADGTDDDMRVINDVGIGSSVIEIMVSFGLHRNLENIFDDFEIHNEQENSSVSFTFHNTECDSVNISYDLDRL